MRKLLVLAFASSLAAGCGGSSSNGGGGTTPLTATVGGRAVTIKDVKAIPASSGATPCTLTLGQTTVAAGIKAIALEATSASSACDAYTSTGCTLHQNAQSVTVVFARIVPQSIANPNPDVTSTPLATTGQDYAINADPTTVTPDGATGYLTATYALALATDASCVPATPPAVQSGTLRFTSVSGPITGHVSVTFVGGDKLEGDFSAPLCTGDAGPNVCSIATSGQTTNPLCPSAPACVP